MRMFLPVSLTTNSLLVIFIQFLFSVSCYNTLLFRSKKCHSLFFSRNEFRSLETEPHIVFLENVLYKRIQEYRNKYIYSDSHKMTEILDNINKYILYPLESISGEEDVIDEEDVIYEEDIIIDEEEGYNEFSMERMFLKKT